LPDSASKILVLEEYKEIQDLLDKMNSNVLKIFKKKEE